jgi:hypothetical protein
MISTEPGNENIAKLLKSGVQYKRRDQGKETKD